MTNINLQDSFKEFCKQNKLEINSSQIKVINLLDRFFDNKETFLRRIFKKKNKLCFYLYGKVGVGKTMLLDFYYDRLKIKKLRQHFNEFMLSYHDFKHEKKETTIINCNNLIMRFGKSLYKYILLLNQHSIYSKPH